MSINRVSYTLDSTLESVNTAEETAQKLATLNMAAHAATKARARGAVIKMIRGMIDEDITPQYGEDRVARRASA